MLAFSKKQVHSFVLESNRIEGIIRLPFEPELAATWAFLHLPAITVPVLSTFVHQMAGGRIRSRTFMDVRIGSHSPPPGGPKIPDQLRDLLVEAQDSTSPFKIHRMYETLHPFMDGNGRSGRAIWAWQMIRQSIRPGISRGFLQTWYYQSLDAAPKRG